MSEPIPDVPGGGSTAGKARRWLVPAIVVAVLAAIVVAFVVVRSGDDGPSGCADYAALIERIEGDQQISQSNETITDLGAIAKTSEGSSDPDERDAATALSAAVAELQGTGSSDAIQQAIIDLAAVCNVDAAPIFRPPDV